MKHEHSPTPFRIGDKGEAAPNTSHILDADGHLVARVESFPYLTTGKADARFMVHACSIHEELVAAADDVVEELTSGFVQPASMRPRLRRLMAAVAKAKKAS